MLSRVNPMAKRRFFVKIMIFPHSTVKRVKKYPFDLFFADLAPTVADEVVLRAVGQKLAAHLPPK